MLFKHQQYRLPGYHFFKDPNSSKTLLTKVFFESSVLPFAASKQTLINDCVKYFENKIDAIWDGVVSSDAQLQRYLERKRGNSLYLCLV